MTPAEQLGQLLADARRADETFDDAWPAAVDQALAAAARTESRRLRRSPYGFPFVRRPRPVPQG